MEIQEKEDYTLVHQKEHSFTKFVTDFEENHKNIENNNTIILLSDDTAITEKEIFVFLKYSEIHVNNGTTFVLVHKGIDIDNFPEDFNIAPTLQEAEDILEMENIQRDLGF